MTPIYKAAFVLVGMASLFWLVLVGLFYFAPVYGITFYPSTTVPIFALAPLFISSFAAQWMTGQRSAVEWWIFRVLVIVGFGIAAFLTEAAIIHAALSQVESITYTEILQAPLSKRYNVSVLFGFSFLTSALLVAAMIVFVSVPARVAIRQRKASAQEPPLT